MRSLTRGGGPRCSLLEEKTASACTHPNLPSQTVEAGPQQMRRPAALPALPPSLSRGQPAGPARPPPFWPHVHPLPPPAAPLHHLICAAIAAAARRPSPL